MTGDGWASQLAQTATAAFVTHLGPRSAASELFRLSLNIPFAPNAPAANVAGVVPVGQAGGFVAENDPIPIVSWNFSAASLSRKKLAMIGVISRELAKSTRAEAEVRRLLQESAALVLDAALFSDAAASDEASAGLFAGLSSITPGNFDADPMINDLASLAASLAPISSSIAYVTSPARAVQIGLRSSNVRHPIIASPAMSDNRIAAVAIDGLAVAIDPVPDIAISAEAILHMSDEPGEIVSDAPVTADPVRSLFQTAAIGIRLIVELDWALRDPGAVAYIDGLSW